MNLPDKANPQLEDGYVRIANELLAAIIAHPFNGGEIKVILYIIRKTYGWNKKSAFITTESISSATGLEIRYVKKLLKKLVDYKVIIKEKTKHFNILSINKTYPQWNVDKLLINGANMTPQSVSENTKNDVLKNIHKRQERQIYKDSSKNPTIKSNKDYLKIPLFIKTIYLKWKKP